MDHFWPVYKMFALTVTKFVFSNSGNFRANVNLPKPMSCPNYSGNDWGPIRVLTGTMLTNLPRRRHVIVLLILPMPLTPPLLVLLRVPIPRLVKGGGRR